ncbi:MAG: MFS transporter [Butyrivibrio sp.]|uniref:MFS transporter n=1 Tax=Butyrivibrio sp. TaxID=28121 RepID=UPI0025F1CE50|nr:MFS transporter [Butyrivibrio sp.]MCR5770712.1 MFS transporter [Butyrivibrio sp.]
MKLKLNYGRTILIGFAFMSICTFWQFYDNEIPRILKYTFGLGEGVTGFIMALDNVFALFLLPLFGTFSDRVNTRFGKRMPFILAGTFLATILFQILINVANVPGRLPLFIVVLLLLLVSMGIYRSPAVAMMPDLTPPPLRSRANAIINLMGTVGAIYTLAMISLLLKDAEDQTKTNYTPLALAISIAMVVSVVILFITINENKIRDKVTKEVEAAGLSMNDADDEASMKAQKAAKEGTDKVRSTMDPLVKRSLMFLLVSVLLWYAAYNAVTTAFSRYVEEVWGLKNGAYANCLMIATVAAVVSYLPIGWISAKIGRKKTILVGVALMSICYFCGVFATGYSNAIAVMFAIIGFGWAAINVNSYPMVVQMSDAADIGKYTGYYYTFSMAAQVFTPIASGLLLEHVSYRTLFPYAFIFSTLAFATMLMVRHGDSEK